MTPKFILKGFEMLILKRKATEVIVINDDIVVTIIKVSGGAVKIAIEAPREIPIRRGELPAKEAA
jgi:carbon storage regulator